MVDGLIGKKLGMTRLFTGDGRWIDVTVLEAGPCTVVQRKTKDRDGYDAVQLGFGELKESRCNKPLKGHFAKAGTAPKKKLQEIRVAADSALKQGDEVKASIFTAGERVDICGVSKGKGFAGVIKRHHFAGGPGAHGSMFHRAPGSIGQRQTPAKVYPNKRMPGHMGQERTTIRNIEIVNVDPERNLLIVRGCVPGAAGGIVTVRKTNVGRKK
jgi:large subunit ribosomal protein L3